MKAGRFDSIDTLRGAAIAWMTAYHFAFDLNHFGWLKEDFYRDPFWTWQRTAIVSLFLFCAGLGQSVAVSQGQDARRFWKRWAQIAACALLVTASSMVMFPRSFIYFGVLHGIALMLVIVRFTSGWGRWLWLAGGVALLLPQLAASLPDAFNSKPLNWLGFITRKPTTEDYVPLFPWLGVMWWGMAAGQWLLAHRAGWLARPLPEWTKPLAFMGRWSLTWYMVHQPVMIGVLGVLAHK